jgi:hypothetical protein
VRDPFTQKVFVNRGSDAGIRAGEAVIDDLGVVGQVTRVFPAMAEVTLVTDKDHAVPVRIERSGVRSVFFGAGAGRAPELRFMAPTADIRPGDKLVTSGIDGTYPAGPRGRAGRGGGSRRRAGVRAHHRAAAGRRRSQHAFARARAGRGVAGAVPEATEADPAKKSGRGKGRRG